MTYPGRPLPQDLAKAPPTAIGRREWLVASGTFLLASCTNSAASSSTNSSTATPTAGPARANDDVARLMRLASVPGMSIATVRGADVSVEGFGVRRAGAETQVTGDTVFEAASLMTSARDYGTFVRWLLGAGPVSGGKPLLGPMATQRVAINDALGWGAGIGLERLDGRQYLWHWGDNPGFKNFVLVEPAASAALVIFTNGNAGMRVYERVIRARTGIDHPAFLWI